MPRATRSDSFFSELRGTGANSHNARSLRCWGQLSLALGTQRLGDQRGFTKVVTLELGLDQGAGMCQVERRMGGISGPSRLQVQRHGGMTRNGTCEVHGMSETDQDMEQGRLTKPDLQRAKEIIFYSKGNGEPWKVLSRGLI